MSDSEFKGTWMTARRKVNEGKDFTKSVPVPFGDDEIDLTHRLMNEKELLRVQANIDQEALLEHQSDGETEEQKELRELQEKDEEERADEEEKRMTALQKEVQRQQVGLMNSLGYDTFKTFCTIGKYCLVPTEADIDDAFNLSIDEQKDRFGEELVGRPDAREKLEDEMEEVVESQPYPIKFTIGQSAYAESMKLFGDEEEEELGNS